MLYTLLSQELRDDPPTAGYASMTDAEAAESLNMANRVVVTPTFCSWRSLLAALGPESTAAIKAKIEAAAQADAGLALALDMLGEYGEGGGLDMGHPNTRAVIDQLAAAEVLTAAEAVAIKSLGERTVSRAQELGLGRVKVGHVHKARAASGG